MKKLVLLICVFTIFAMSCSSLVQIRHDYQPFEVEYSRYIQPPNAKYEIKDVIFVTASASYKVENGVRTRTSGEILTYEMIMKEAIKIGANGVINIVIDNSEIRTGSNTYTRRQTATALAIKYIPVFIE